MKSKSQDFETEFRKEVLKFLKRNGLTMSKLGNSATVQYSNIDKLNDYFLRETGWISSRVIGRIKKFIHEFKGQPCQT
jgi:hypothetical protein